MLEKKEVIEVIISVEREDDGVQGGGVDGWIGGRGGEEEADEVGGEAGAFDKVPESEFGESGSGLHGVFVKKRSIEPESPFALLTCGWPSAERKGD